MTVFPLIRINVIGRYETVVFVAQITVCRYRAHAAPHEINYILKKKFESIFYKLEHQTGAAELQLGPLLLQELVRAGAAGLDHSLQFTCIISSLPVKRGFNPGYIKIALARPVPPSRCFKRIEALGMKTRAGQTYFTRKLLASSVVWLRLSGMH